MKILHTSDWHLGRSFHGASLLESQAAYLDQLLATIASEHVDLLVVSGDIYDRALPPIDAVRLFDDTLHRLAGARVRTVITSGNHDSPVRLGVGSRLADRAGIHVRARWEDVATPITLEDGHGPVHVYGIPYLEPAAVRQAWDLDAVTHEAALEAATGRIHTDLATRGGRSVVLAHAFVAGSAEAALPMRSDSERDISVGGLQIAPTRLFNDFDYAALGHLHSPSTLADHIRYSGSPVAYSFSEEGRTKGSWLVELGAGGVDRADFVEAPVTRPIKRLSATLDALLTEPSYAGFEDHWLGVTLTDEQRPVDAMERLRSRFPHVLTLVFAPSSGSIGALPGLDPGAAPQSDPEIAWEFFTAVTGRRPTDPESELLFSACDSCSPSPTLEETG